MAYDVFISWTGTDVKIKERIAAFLRSKGLTVLLSDEKCRGDFIKWSREAATSTHLFMTIVTENALKSEGMGWELDEIDKKLCSEEGEFWKQIIIPVCKSMDIFEQYKAKLSEEGQGVVKSLSAIFMETDEEGLLTEKCLENIYGKTVEGLIDHMHTLYRSKSKPDYIKLIPLCNIDIADSAHPFEKLYIQRKITEIDKDRQECGSFDTPKTLLTGEAVSFIYGPAGCGKTQYINQIRAASAEDDLVIALSCADVSIDSRDLFEILFDKFKKTCGNRGFYTENDFNTLLNHRRLVLVLDGLDEITTTDDTRFFVEKINAYYTSNKRETTLIFLGRSEKDAKVLSAFGGIALRQFRLDKLTDPEIETLGNNLFLLFNDGDKGNEFYVRVKELNEEIRTNPLLLSQLAIIYKEEKENMPETVIGILDAVSEIALRSDKVLHGNLKTVPPQYQKMINSDISGILKRFSRNKYEESLSKRPKDSSQIFANILLEKYHEDKDDIKQRRDYLMEYLNKRAIFVDGKFYHKTFLEYFTAVSYYEEWYDEDYGDITDEVVDKLFEQYNNPNWSDVLKLFLVKADSRIDGLLTEELYEQIASNRDIADFTLLFDACRDLISHKEEAQRVLVRTILERSAEGEYPAYGPLFWYVPEYELYESAALAAEELSGNAKALALVRDVCFIFGRKYTLADITDKVDGEKLYRAAKPDLSGVRDGLCQLFCTGKTDCNIGTDIYPRCFNIAEAKNFLEIGHGVFGRMKTVFKDELGLWGESYPELGDEYIGFISCPYDKVEMERRLGKKPTAKVRGLALLNSEDSVLDYVHFVRTSVRAFYIPENVTEVQKDYDTFMNIDVPCKFMGEAVYGEDDPFLLLYVDDLVKYSLTESDMIVYMPRGISKVIVPDGVKTLSDGFLRNEKCLEEIHLPYGISKIPAEAFMGCKNLRKINIPDLLTEIGERAFIDCESLNNITLPNSVKKIEDDAFAFCKGLTNIIIPDSVEAIENSVFLCCINLKSIVIPDSIAAIADNTFEGCTNLTGINLPKFLKKIGNSAFGGCSSLGSISIPDSVTKIGSSAFNGCTNLSSISLPASIKKIDSEVFSGCTNLVGISIPDSVAEIGSSAFAECTSLASINIPDSVKSIGLYAFAQCTALTSISIPDSVEKIDSDTFEGCENLKEIILPSVFRFKELNLPESTEIIYREAEPTYAPTLTEITVENGRKEILEKEFSHSKIEKIYLPDSLEKIGAYAFEGCEKIESITLPDSVREIGTSAFKNCTSLKSINIPDSVTEIAISAFEGCSNLKSIVIPDSVKRIDTTAFSDCVGLEKITLPDSVAEMGEGVFSGCEGLREINLSKALKTIPFSAFKSCVSLNSIAIPDSVTEIAPYAFCGCSDLRSIAIPDSVTKIGHWAFQRCRGLTEISLPLSVTEIGSSAFQSCSALRSITIPDSVRKIGSNAFEDCKALISVRLPDSIEEIAWNLFKGCTNLESVTIPHSVKNICAEAFKDCTGIDKIVLPDSVTIIDYMAFKGCTNLGSINIPDSVTEIGIDAFEDCTALRSITIPDSIKKIDYGAFRSCSSLTEITLPKSIRHIGSWAFANCTSLRSVRISSNFKNDIPRIFGDNFDSKIIEWLN